MMKRILAFDVGDRRIGVAVSDALGITAQPVETYHRKGGAEKDAEYLLALAKRYAPCTLLFGLPRNMDGTYGEQAEKVKKFAQRLIDQWDTTSASPPWPPAGCCWTRTCPGRSASRSSTRWPPW